MKRGGRLEIGTILIGISFFPLEERIEVRRDLNLINRGQLPLDKNITKA
jgi:hypothetical protein